MAERELINDWVETYFKEFNINPGNVGRYYDNHANFSRDDHKVPGKNRILKVYTSPGYNSPRVDEQTLKFDYLLAEPAKYDEAGFIVNAWGTMFFLGVGNKKFNQSFRLVSDEHGHLKIMSTILSVHAN